LTQSSGTCWLNTAINSLFLPKEIVPLLINQYDKLSPNDKKISEIPFKNFDCKKCDLRILLNALVYNLIINKTKAQRTDGNFVGILASRIKCSYKSPNSDLCFDIKYGDGWDASIGVKIILNHIMNSNDYVYINVIEYENNAINIIVQKRNNIVQKINDNISEQNNTKSDFAQKQKEYNIMVNKYNSMVPNSKNAVKNNINDKLKQLNTIKENHVKLSLEYDKLKKLLMIKDNELAIRKEKIAKNLLNFTNYDIEKNIVIIGNPKIIVIECKKMSIKTTLNFNGKLYKLCSGGISINIEHSIVGIVCNDKYYIFDSNNIISEANWYTGDISNYANNDETKKLYTKDIKLISIDYAVYILSN
jgi:hypothetical protein